MFHCRRSKRTYMLKSATEQNMCLKPQNPKYINAGIGSSHDYSVDSTAEDEPGGSGKIIIYNVDVEIGEVKEGKEMTEGAFLASMDCDFAIASKTVTIKCLPDYDAADEIAVSCIGNGMLIDNATMEAAKEKYSAPALKGKTFTLYSMKPSESLRDSSIYAQNIRNKCEDTALFTVVGLETRTATVNFEPEPEKRSRRTIGFFEVVDITIKPSGVKATWSCSIGNGGSNNNLFAYAAPGYKSNPVIATHLNDLNLTLSVKFYVLIPTGVKGHSTSVDPWEEIKHSAGMPGKAGVWMAIRFKVLPENVSFEHIEVHELTVTSTDALGYFADTSVWAAFNLIHIPGGAFKIKEKNNVFGTDGAGNAFIPSYPDNTWADGSYSWDIPALWSGFDTHSFLDGGAALPWTTQTFFIKENGTASVAKFKFKATRRLSDTSPTITDLPQ